MEESKFSKNNKTGSVFAGGLRANFVRKNEKL